MDAYHRRVILREVAPYILHTPLLTKNYCNYLVNALEANNSWKQFKGDDKYATHDINLEECFPEIFKSLSSVFMGRLAPLISDWYETEVLNPYTIFAIKYSSDTQTSLNLHRDESYISASIKLNSNYEGGLLEFPDQQWNNQYIGVGDIIIFPGTITHPHRSSELLSGTKYSLTFWTPHPQILLDNNN